MSLSLSLGSLSAVVAGLFSAHVLIKLCFPYFGRDLVFLLRILLYGFRLEMFKLTGAVVTVLDRFIQQAHRHPAKPFIIYEGRTYTYGDIEERSNKVANVFRQRGNLKKGDCVALLMSNEPDFVCVWFGLAKIGCSVAFLNTNIKSRSLLHCFTCCGAKTLIVGSDLVGCLDDILSSLLGDSIEVWALRNHSDNKDIHTLLDKVEAASFLPVPDTLRATSSLKAPTLYIFTSGTTGLPKAAVITHLQTLKAAGGFWALGGNEDDVLYICLPLYHSAASLLGIGGTIHLGATCILKKKFSASQFWDDCRKHDVTIFQYIGELCRYLCNRPQVEEEKVHKVRMAVGNGLRQDVGRQFLNRFGNIRMCEIYGSTEGNLCFINHIGKIGVVGRSNFFYKLIFKYNLVKYDVTKDEIVKDKNGFCQRVGKGQSGLLLSKVCTTSPFFGYAGSKQLTEKRLMRNVFAKGDAYFNTGDLMAEDQDGFISFTDRLGDTFRWKGENVATTEVTETLGLVDFIEEINVYGVEIPGHEGRAGMCAVVVRQGHVFDGGKLFEHAERDLPSYARPLFIRIQEVIELTSTFKQQKFQLVQSGFNPATICEPLYVLDYAQRCYIPLTDSIYQSILTGERKL
ncbi:long-chain fatty acid transport protein 6 [Genypterus blacodes]|uniref:long-chain fatty acid transport protein 6 n=1 Tax=Genypterus blacodes TaxID=154954 RepID=UPI003F75CBCC